MVDNKQTALNAAAEISYLGSKKQAELLKAMECEENSPSIAQTKKMREFSQQNKLSADKLRKCFPKSYFKQQMEDTILKLIENWYQKRQQEMKR